MSRHTHEAETDWFEFDIKAADGKVFSFLPDVKAEVEVNDEDCSIYRVIKIFTEQTDRKTKLQTRVYLDPQHQLWSDIEAYILDNEDALMEGERESQGLSWHTPRSVEEASIIGVGEWRRART